MGSRELTARGAYCGAATRPVYLFTWHAYGTWMADRRRGYVERHKGTLPSNPELAAIWRSSQAPPTASFDEPLQTIMLEELLTARDPQRYRLHSVACEVTHVHVLASWTDERPWRTLHGSIRQSLSRRLGQIEHRPWLVKNGSRKRVQDREHFERLTRTYLPSHRGWKWDESRGYFQ